MDLEQLPQFAAFKLHRFVLSQQGDLVKIHLVAVGYQTCSSCRVPSKLRQISVAAALLRHEIYVVNQKESGCAGLSMGPTTQELNSISMRIDLDSWNPDCN